MYIYIIGHVTLFTSKNSGKNHSTFTAVMKICFIKL